MTQTDEILGYAVEFMHNNEPNGYIQKFKFKFNVMKQEATEMGYTRINNPTLKTNKDSYIYDIDTAKLIAKVIKLYNKESRICLVKKININGKDKIEIKPV